MLGRDPHSESSVDLQCFISSHSAPQLTSSVFHTPLPITSDSHHAGLVYVPSRVCVCACVFSRGIFLMFSHLDQSSSLEVSPAFRVSSGFRRRPEMRCFDEDFHYQEPAGWVSDFAMRVCVNERHTHTDHSRSPSSKCEVSIKRLFDRGI